MAQVRHSELLIGRKAVCEEFNISEEQFYTFLTLGMPMRKINRYWYGHRDNINEWFRRNIVPGDPITVDGSRASRLVGED